MTSDTALTVLLERRRETRALLMPDPRFVQLGNGCREARVLPTIDDEGDDNV